MSKMKTYEIYKITISYLSITWTLNILQVFFHRELPEVLPRMPVSRWINEYEFHFEKAPMINVSHGDCSFLS